MKAWMLFAGFTLACFQAAFAQSATSTISRTPASHLIVPQSRPFHPPTGSVEVQTISASIDIADQLATTTLEVNLTNRSNLRLESQILIPVPEGAVLRGFTFLGNSLEPTAELLPRDEARRIYNSIVATTRDPALLEFLGCNLVQSSVFPVEPRSGQKVRITYELLLEKDGDRVDFILPRTESVDYRVPWTISVRIRSKDPIATLYSPSHNIQTTRHSENLLTAQLAPASRTDPGPFRLSWLLQRSDFSATLLAYPDLKVGGGYFLLLAAPPVRPEPAHEIKRELLLVLDRSGSMAGEKLEQVRAAALQVLEGLDEGESFNIIVYNEGVETFSPLPVPKNDESIRAARQYLRTLRVRGGTNIHDALQEALRMKHVPGTLPLVLFLTDGLPTVGQTSEKSIRDLVANGNFHQRRIFTFGVGFDVNTPLLDKIALSTRATSTFVLPQEDVEVKVAQVFKRLSGPLLAEPTLKVFNNSGTVAHGRVRDLLPSRLPDLFEGDQLVLFGQYIGEEPLIFELRANDSLKPRTFRFRFNLDHATTKNAFIPRLWASRKIAVLTDAIRDLGVTPSSGPDAASDPRLKELVQEIVSLSKEFGILTEYTAFLAREGADLSHPTLVLNQALNLFDSLALKSRSGPDSLSQSLNNESKRAQTSENYRNIILDSEMKAVEFSTIQQVNDRAFFKRGNRWIDSSLVDQPNPAPNRVVQFDSAEFRSLAERLAAQNRQGTITLKGEILLRVDNENILVR